MKGILIGIIIILWLAGVYFAFIHVIGKTMRPSQSTPEDYQPARLQQEQDQAQKLQSVADQQRRLMEDRQRRMRNH